MDGSNLKLEYFQSSKVHRVSATVGARASIPLDLSQSGSSFQGHQVHVHIKRDINEAGCHACSFPTALYMAPKAVQTYRLQPDLHSNFQTCSLPWHAAAIFFVRPCLVYKFFGFGYRSILVQGLANIIQLQIK